MVERAPDGVRGGEHGREVRAAERPGGRADGDHDCLGTADHGRKVRRKHDTACFLHLLEELWEARLIKRRLAHVESGDFGGIRIHAGHPMPEFGIPKPGHQPDISGSDHHHVHSAKTLTKQR